MILFNKLWLLFVFPLFCCFNIACQTSVFDYVFREIALSEGSTDHRRSWVLGVDFTQDQWANMQFHMLQQLEQRKNPAMLDGKNRTCNEQKPQWALVASEKLNLFLHTRKNPISIKRKNFERLRYSPRSRGPNGFWGFVLCQIQDSAIKHNKPPQKITQIWVE